MWGGEQALAAKNHNASFHSHSRSEGTSECVERDGEVAQLSLSSDRPDERPVGTEEGQPLPPPDSVPADNMVCPLVHFFVLHHHFHPTTICIMFAVPKHLTTEDSSRMTTKILGIL